MESVIRCPSNPIVIQSASSNGLGSVNISIADVNIRTLLPIGNHSYHVDAHGGKISCDVKVHVIGEISHVLIVLIYLSFPMGPMSNVFVLCNQLFFSKMRADDHIPIYLPSV